MTQTVNSEFHIITDAKAINLITEHLNALSVVLRVFFR
jgi:hypothetical protein